MDQSKWSLPRLRHGIMTKAMQKLERPRVKVQGVWAANVSLTLNVVDVRQSSDATMVVEALARTLERVAGICSDLGKKILQRSWCGFPASTSEWHWVSNLEYSLFSGLIFLV